MDQEAYCTLAKSVHTHLSVLNVKWTCTHVSQWVKWPMWTSNGPSYTSKSTCAPSGCGQRTPGCQWVRVKWALFQTHVPCGTHAEVDHKASFGLTAVGYKRVVILRYTVHKGIQTSDRSLDTCVKRVQKVLSLIYRKSECLICALIARWGTQNGSFWRPKRANFLLLAYVSRHDTRFIPFLPISSIKPSNSS